MLFLWIGLGLAAVAAAVLGVAYYSFRSAFVYKKKNLAPGEFDLPHGTVFEPFYDLMLQWMKDTRKIPHREVSTRSHDGYLLKGTFYEHKPGAPIEIMFHGYQGSGERDLCGGVMRCFRMGHSALVVDQRSTGRSEGRAITFGIKERKDCLSWVEFTKQTFGEDVKVILTGISMGAATVLMSAAEPLPENVKGILADCGYTSPKAIIHIVLRKMGLPVRLVYPFVKLGARIFGGFDLEETSPLEAMKNCKVPVIFFHGEADDFVPCFMSRENYEACTAPKQLHTFPGAGHCLGYLVDQEGYLKALDGFYNSLPGLRGDTKHKL